MIELLVKDPKDYKQSLKKKPFVITYGYHNSPFGKCLIGVSGKYICHFSFVTGSEAENFKALEDTWPGASYVEDKKGTEKFISDVFEDKENTVFVMSKGTPFQERVWRALLKIKKGQTVSYEGVAEMIGSPKAIRAAATACAKNPVCYLIPCHRVISKSGKIHNYGWGVEMKKKLLDYEEENTEESEHFK